MTAEPVSNEPEPRGGSHDQDVPGVPVCSGAAAADRQPGGLLAQTRQRFQELAASCVARCELTPELARAVLHSLELGLAQTIKEDGPVMQRQFGQNVEAAVAWAAESLVEACRHLAADTPGRKRSPLQNLALLEVQALEIMLPELSQTSGDVSDDRSVPAAELQAFCALLNDGLDCAQKADMAADRGDQRAYRRHYVLSRTKLRNAAAMLRRMLHQARSDMSDVAVGLRGFQLELAAHAGSLRMFLKALRARHAVVHVPQYHGHILDPHCSVADLLPILFNRHFAFTIVTARGISASRSQELITTAHKVMWEQVGLPITTLLDQPDRLRPPAFKEAVDAELRTVITAVNQQYASDGVVISISSNNVREIRQRAW